MSFPLSRPVCVQLAVATVALAAVALAPPAEGPMLLVPVVGDSADAIRIATAHGARLLGPTRGGALLVWGDARLLRPLAGAGVIPLAAPFSACGTTPA